MVCKVSNFVGHDVMFAPQRGHKVSLVSGDYLITELNASKVRWRKKFSVSMPPTSIPSSEKEINFICGND